MRISWERANIHSGVEYVLPSLLEIASGPSGTSIALGSRIHSETCALLINYSTPRARARSSKLVWISFHGNRRPPSITDRQSIGPLSGGLCLRPLPLKRASEFNSWVSFICLFIFFRIHVSDKRTTNWFLMGSPFPTLFMCLSYVYLVKVLGPKLMENRKPFHLKKVLIVYNLFQVIFSTWLFYEVSLRRRRDSHGYCLKKTDKIFLLKFHVTISRHCISYLTYLCRWQVHHRIVSKRGQKCCGTAYILQ